MTAAEFIADARTSLPAALNALDAVLALADDWDTKAAQITAYAKRAEIEPETRDMLWRDADGMTTRAHELRAAIAEALGVTA